jgi:hypothetical protein
MGSPDDLDRLLALGSDRPAIVDACVDEADIDDGELLAYRRGALSEAQREHVERHLVACAYCRDLASHLGRTRRSRWPAVVATAAAIAAAVLFVVTPDPKEAIGQYSVVEVRGANSQLRGPEQVDGRIFGPHSQVEIKVEPSGGRAAEVVRAFRLEQGVLVPANATIEPGVSGVFWIRGSGRDLFGDTAGAKRLVIVAADGGADLSRIEGRTLVAAQSLTAQTSWLPAIEAEYRLE